MNAVRISRLSKLMCTKQALEGRLDHAYMHDNVIESMDLEEQLQDLSMQIARLNQRV